MCRGRTSYRTSYTFNEGKEEEFKAQLAVCRVFTTSRRTGLSKRRAEWLLFIMIALDWTPEQCRQRYRKRFGVEHGIRFMKRDLGLTAGQFNSLAAEGRVQVWVEMVGCAFWFLWALSGLAKIADQKLILGWWKKEKITHGAVRRLAAGLLLKFGWKKPQPKPRGKSQGRAKGTKLEARKRSKPVRQAARPAL